MYNPYSLENKTILITGASSGIGRSTAIECSKSGVRLVITGRNPIRLHETYLALEGEGHVQVDADLTVYEDLERLVDSCPKLDGFVSNAGITKILFVKHIKKSFLDDVFQINSIAPVLLTQLLLNKNKFNKPASIVFTSALSGLHGVHYGEAMFAASKGAINGFVKGAALDLAVRQIRVNSVNPGIIFNESFSGNGVLTREELLEKEKFFPLKRFGKPVDVAHTIVFLLSDATSWITGSSIVVDGGYSLI